MENLEMEKYLGTILKNPAVHIEHVATGRGCGKSLAMLDEWYRKNLLNVKTTFFLPEIKNVIFNEPATIVFWADGTKTVVKAQDGEKFDEEKGLAMAISKKALGNTGKYYNIFKKWSPEKKSDLSFDESVQRAVAAVRELATSLTQTILPLD